MDTPRVDIQAALAKCVRAIGGQVLDDTLGGARPFKNADYHFPHEGVVAELKILSEDILQKEDFKQATGKLYERWVREGKVKSTPALRAVVSSADLPPACAKELFGLLRARFESSTIKQANKQLRETKKHLNVKDAVGLLILANDGNYAFTPDVLFSLLYEALRNRHRSIDAVIFFTANEPLTLPGFERSGAQLWTDLVVDGRRTLPEGFSEKLGREWRRLYSELTSATVFEFQVDPPKPEDMGKVGFVGNRIRKTPQGRPGHDADA